MSAVASGSAGLASNSQTHNHEGAKTPKPKTSTVSPELFRRRVGPMSKVGMLREREFPATLYYNPIICSIL